MIVYKILQGHLDRSAVFHVGYKLILLFATDKREILSTSTKPNDHPVAYQCAGKRTVAVTSPRARRARGWVRYIRFSCRDWGPKGRSSPETASLKGACQRTLYVFLVICENPDFRTWISETSGWDTSLKFVEFIHNGNMSEQYDFHGKRLKIVAVRQGQNIRNLR